MLGRRQSTRQPYGLYTPSFPESKIVSKFRIMFGNNSSLGARGQSVLLLSEALSSYIMILPPPCLCSFCSSNIISNHTSHSLSLPIQIFRASIVPGNFSSIERLHFDKRPTSPPLNDFISTRSQVPPVHLFQSSRTADSRTKASFLRSRIQNGTMQFKHLITVLGFVSTVFGCMHGWKLPAAPREPSHVQEADIPLPEAIEGRSARIPRVSRIRGTAPTNGTDCQPFGVTFE